MTAETNSEKKYQKVQGQITDQSKSALKRYQSIVIGSSSLFYTLRYELLVSTLSGFPGAAGLWLRSKFYRGLFKQFGKGTVIGNRVNIRHPKKITLGSSTVIADQSVLDARGESNTGIITGTEVILGQNAVLVCKDGDIEVGDRVGIGTNTAIIAVAGNCISIGKDSIIAPYSYLGGISYHIDRTDIPIAKQGHNPKGGIVVEDNVWIGAHTTILDGVTIGHDAIIASGAVVTENIPPFAIAGGIPAKVIRSRN